MLRKLTKKRMLLVGVAVLVAATAAFAYFTSTGSGTGSGSVSTPSGTITLAGTVDNALAPGGQSTVSLTATNNTGSSLRVGTVSGTVSVDDTHATAGCDKAWFTLDDATEDQDIASDNTAHALTNKATIHMSNESTSQDACQGATLSLDLSSN